MSQRQDHAALRKEDTLKEQNCLHYTILLISKRDSIPQCTLIHYKAIKLYMYIAYRRSKTVSKFMSNGHNTNGSRLLPAKVDERDNGSVEIP